MNRAGVGLLLLVVAVVALVGFQLSVSKVIHSGGRIIVTPIPGGPPPLPSENLDCEVYADSSMAVVLSHIDWGECYPGQTKTYGAYVFNSGNVALVMGLFTENWSPSNASDYISLSWNYDNRTIPPSEGMSITFSLTISPYITGIDIFSFDIVVGIAKA